MFEYEMPCGPFQTITSVKDGKVTFEPPVYEQRYCAAIEILGDSRWDKQIKKIVDFGCAEMKLLPLLRRLDHVEHILEVDVDDSLLKKNKCCANPLISDYLNRRQLPLTISLLHGSIADSGEELRNVDAVIALEIIEHVYDDVLKKIPQNVFGFIQPKLAIISTPNAEFNVLFGQMLANGFRHYDHKFEWTRQEFQQWCLTIVESYPIYKVSFMGVGKAPDGKDALGFVTQIALFVRHDLINAKLQEAQKKPSASNNAKLYKTIHKVHFPQNTDHRSPEEKTIDEIKIQINRLTSNSSYYNKDEGIYKIPISEYLDYTAYLSVTESVICDFLQELRNVEITDDFIIVQCDSSTFDSSREDFNVYDDTIKNFDTSGDTFNDCDDTKDESETMEYI